MTNSSILRLILFCILPLGSFAQSDRGEIQDMAESSVEKYVRSVMLSAGSYRGFSFGEVEVLIPSEVKYLEELKENKKVASGMKDHFGPRHDSVLVAYDTLIARQERLIIQKKVRNNYKVDHLFSINQMEKHTIFEAEFFLSANFKVKNVKVSMDAVLNKEDYDWFYYYFMGYGLFVGGTEEENAERTAAVYDHFSSRITSEKENKNEVLYSLIAAVKTIRKTDVYDPAAISKIVIHSWMLRHKSEYPGYIAGDFSSVKAIYSKDNGSEELVGYSLFHRFTAQDNKGQLGLQCFYFELDAWFVPAGTMIAEAPFEKYFDGK